MIRLLFFIGLFLSPSLLVAAEAPEPVPIQASPSWFYQEELTPCGQSLLQLLKAADAQGLNSDLYEPLLTALLSNRASKTTEEWNALLNQALRHYLSWAAGSRKNLTVFDATTHLDPQPIEGATIETLICAQDPAKIEKLGPQHPQAIQLKRLLAFYLHQKKAGGWGQIPSSFRAAIGDINDTVLLLKKQLEMQGYPVEGNKVSFLPTPNLFHAGVQKALRLFQIEHALDPSGNLSKETIQEFNKSVDARINQIRVNLERWRWLPPYFQDRTLIVNIPTYQLVMLEGEKPVKQLSIIVGKTASQTPSFATSLSVITLNPSWSVPYSIATKEKLPAFRRNPGKASAYQIISTATGAPVLPSQINWDQVSSGNFPYQLRMESGRQNPLGPIKFTIPNSFSIFMHGTTNPQLFEKLTRAFSWGCIRISDPFLVAEFALNTPEWSKQALEKAAATKKTKTLHPPSKVPVYLTYFTIWMGEEGRPHFAPDVYGKDGQVLSTLDKQLTLSAKPFGGPDGGK